MVWPVAGSLWAADSVSRTVGSMRSTVDAGRMRIVTMEFAKSWEGHPHRDGGMASLRRAALFADRAERLTADEDGAVVYATSASPRSVLVFDRDRETGLLTFRALREFSSETDRDDFVGRKREEWTRRLGDQLRK